jgi:hypothetical protein
MPSVSDLTTKFTDSTGQEWDLAVTWGTCLEHKRRTGHQLTDFVDPKSEFYQSLAGDLVYQIEFVLTVLDEQLKAHGITDEQFLARIRSGDDVAAVMGCVRVALANFSRSASRETILFAERQERAAQQKLHDQVVAKLESLTAAQTERVDQQIAELVATIALPPLPATSSGAPSGAGSESLDSEPTPND